MNRLYNTYIKTPCLLIKRLSPIYITMPDKAPLAFAGLWETWRDRHTPDKPYRSCTIITRAASGPIKEVHHRMPVILHPDAYASWLDPANSDKARLSEMLQSQAITKLVYLPVAKQVNAVRNNDPSNLTPVQRHFDF